MPTDDDDDYPSDAADDWEEVTDDDEDEQDEDESDDEDPDEDPKVELPPPPDHQDAVAALKDVGARLDLNEQGNVWRVFFYDKNTDAHLAQIRNLPSLREIWLIGSKVTKPGAEGLRERLPKVTIYH